ncbi:cytochrome P450 71D6-like [Solanum stenotomum]|uniref:cytochrome P450 71D6-like n=1 Tax=Solanum stenotomum TaxID=172797 RepID=UPI0020D0E3DB|nr:cytochrome P450 71D6-like [Solanum stenotomum]
MSELMKNPSMMEKAQTEVREAFNGKTTIDQIDLKKRIVNMWALGRASEYWEEAEKFEPERFNESPLDVSGNHFQFIPFRAGRRICPDINFSMASMELYLAQLLCHFDWKLVNGVASQQLDMPAIFGNVAEGKNSLYLLASPFGKQDAR